MDRLSQVHRCLSALAWLSTLLLAPHSGGPVLGQPVPGQPVSEETPQSSAPRRSLAALLDQVSWDPARRGPLLIVAPEQIMLPWRPSGASGAILPPLPKAGYSLAQLAPLYGQRLHRLNDLTVLAPARRAVIPEQVSAAMLPYRAEELYSFPIALIRFLGSLNQEQWKRAGSGDGIGRGDLTLAQLPLFADLFPPNPLLRYNTPQRVVRLSETQTAGARLRIGRTYDLYLVAEGGANAGTVLSLTDVPQVVASLESAATPSPPAERAVPNRLVPGELDLESAYFQAPVFLTDAKTVAEVVARVSTASRIALAVDARLGALPIHFRGGTVAGGEALKALCWAIPASFRRLQGENGPVALLTFDTEGIAPQLTRLTTRAMELLLPLAARAVGQEQEAERARDLIFQRRPLSLLQPLPSLLARGPKVEGRIPFLPPPDLQGQLSRPDLDGTPFPLPDPDVAAYLRTYEKYKAAGRQRIAVTRLSGELQTAIQHLGREYNQNHPPEDPPVRADQVEVRLRVSAWLTLPEFGLVCQHQLPPVYPVPPAPVGDELRLPRGTHRGKNTLCVTATDGAAARKAVAAAHRQRFSEIWFRLPTSLSEAEQRAILEAAIALGKQSGIAVGAMVPVLAREGQAKDESSDLTCTGETAAEWARQRLLAPALAALPRTQARLARTPDWLRPESPAALARVAGIARIATVDGLASIALVDLAPPELALESDDYLSTGAGLLYPCVGYTSSSRATALSALSVDPLDLALPEFGRLLLGESLPGTYHLSDSGRLTERWLEMRRQAVRGFLVSLYRRLKTVRPGLPVLAAPSQQGQEPDWWAEWEEESHLPPALAPRTSRIRRYWLRYDSWQLRRETGSGISAPPKESDPTSFSRFLAEQLARLRSSELSPWLQQGVVVDLSRDPLEKALELIQVIPTPDLSS